MKKFLLLLLFALYLNEGFAQTITYPKAAIRPVTDEFYDKYKVTDDYRWMENLQDPEVKQWVHDENAISQQFIAKASGKNNTHERIDELASSNFHDPVKKGNYYFTYAYYDKSSLPALFIQNSLKDDEPRLLVDPNFISRKDKITIRDYEVSRNSKYLAYEYSRNGSDWVEINIQEINGGALNDHLTHVKFSDIAWQGNGFFYSAYPQLNDLDKTEGQMVYYHKIGTPQSADSLIFKRNDPTIEFDFITTSDGRYFVLQEYNRRTNTASYFYINYQEAQPTLKPLITNLKYCINVIDSHNGKLIATDFHNADNGSIVEIDPQNPMQWKAIAPAFSQARLLNIVPLKDKIMAVYQSNLQPAIVAIDYDGQILHSLSFPLGTSVNWLGSQPDDTELNYSYRSYTTPPVVYKLDVNSYERKLARQVSINFDYEDFVYKKSEYVVNDSLKVPIMLIYKKGIKLDGSNPTLLETYGGYGSVNEPEFDPGIVYFLSKGGIYAYAYVRGSGELGESWAKAGEGRNKQYSFSDFIAGAEYLVKEGYTNPAKLAITGASNGGLVVAAAAVQRPDLFKAVVPVVAPLDMIRFENFTIGALNLNKSEFGTVTTLDGFNRLYSYSPYNNIKAAVNYPAMLIITSENDDRVPPFHSFKFAARLQNRPAQTNPVLLMVNRQAGHYGIRDNSLLAELKEEASMYAFIIELLK